MDKDLQARGKPAPNQNGNVIAPADASVRPFTIEKAVSYTDLARKIQEPANPERVKVFTITEETADRVRDVVVTKGINTKEFVQAPRFQQFHNRNAWPIGRPISIQVDEKSITGAFEFDEVITDPASGTILDGRGEIAFQQVTRGNVNQVSIGIIPKRQVWRDSNMLTAADKKLFELHPEANWLITKSELFEVSLVTVASLRSAKLIKSYLQECVGGECQMIDIDETTPGIVTGDKSFDHQQQNAPVDWVEKALGVISDYEDRKRSEGHNRIMEKLKEYE